MKIISTAAWGLLLLGISVCAQGQETHSAPGSQTHVERKLIYKVDPYYPTDLKRLFIGGVVRLKIVVSAKGTVETITPLGGNPAFVENSVAAVKKWKYAPADNSTELQINLDFDPRR